jgi:hypothetical protein
MYFNTTGFLIPLRQKTCRVEKIGIDQTFLETEVQLPSRSAVRGNKEKNNKKSYFCSRP